MYKERLVSDRMLRMVGHFPVVVVSGARQVGKSTLIEHLFPAWNRVVFDPVVDVGNARADPDLFLDNHPPPLVLDEIQYCPELVPSLKRRIDRDRQPGRYILTGSQQWSVMAAISESLAGRAVFIDLDGFSLAEVCEAPLSNSWLSRYLDDPAAFVKANGDVPRLNVSGTLYERMWRGWLPEVDRLPLDLVQEYFVGYLRTYIERDVRLLLQVDDWQQFGRFVQMTAALTAQEVNYSQLGREIGVTPQTARRWLAVLQATFHWYELPAWHGNTIKRVSSKPKGHVADTGLACYLLRLSSPDALAGNPMIGALFESVVAGEIRKQMSVLSRKAQIYHWRSHGGAEVDLLLERDGLLYPVEIKLGTRLSRKDARGLRMLRETYPGLRLAPGLVIAPVGRLEQLTEHDHAAPWDMC
jgi:predicted AAA+ superfamily ATPase